MTRNIMDWGDIFTARPYLPKLNCGIQNTFLSLHQGVLQILFPNSNVEAILGATYLR